MRPGELALGPVAAYHDVHVDVPRLPNHAVDDRAADEQVKATSSGRPEHDQRSALGATERYECASNVVADDFVISAAEIDDQLSPGSQHLARGVLAYYVGPPNVDPDQFRS